MKEDRRSELFKDLGIAEMDQSAQSIGEICAETGMSDVWIGRKIARLIEAGKWERVCKKNPKGRTIPAYRRKR